MMRSPQEGQACSAGLAPMYEGIEGSEQLAPPLHSGAPTGSTLGRRFSQPGTPSPAPVQHSGYPILWQAV